VDFFDNPVVLSIAIFIARVADVALGTVRTILIFRGHPKTAAFIGFFEILIWLLAAAQAIQNLDRWYLAIAYAAGFATGNYVGIWLESKLALGTELVRAISRDLTLDLAGRLRARGHAVIELAGNEDAASPVEVLLIVERRRRVPDLLAEIREIDPSATITISDVKRQVRLSLPPDRPGILPAGWRSRGKRK